MDRTQIIQENIEKIRKRISRAAEKSGRAAKDVQLVAVTKGVELEGIRAAITAGISILAENKIQEVREKFFQIGPVVAWHMIGHLQTNKAKHAARIFDMVQSVDSVRVAEALDRECGKLDRQMDVLVEVNISTDENKFGAAVGDTEQLAARVRECPNLRLRGLMCMAPYVPDPELTRPFFRQMNQLFQKLKKQTDNPHWNVLSMGMTNDFEIAIEEGATLVRVGTGIFHTPELRNEQP